MLQVRNFSERRKRTETIYKDLRSDAEPNQTHVADRDDQIYGKSVGHAKAHRCIPSILRQHARSIARFVAHNIAHRETRIHQFLDEESAFGSNRQQRVENIE